MEIPYQLCRLRERCSKVLPLLKKLWNTKWGSISSTLPYLHVTLLLSNIYNGSHVYASASTCLLKELVPLHNTGTFKSTLFVSLYSQKGLCPLDQRRIEYSLSFYSRALRCPSKLSCVINNAVIPQIIGPRSFYPYVKIWFLRHFPNSTPFWKWIKPPICK